MTPYPNARDLCRNRFKNGGRGWDNPMKAAKGAGGEKREAARSELKNPDQVTCRAVAG